MVVLPIAGAQVAARDLDFSVSRDRAAVDLTQFPSLEESIKVNKNEIPGGLGMGSSGKAAVSNRFDQPLQFFPPVEKDGKLLVQPPRSVLDDGAKQWSNALIATFLGKSPVLNVFQRTSNRLWGREGSVKIRFLALSVYMVNFPSQRVRDWVLEAGPWHIQQKALVLRKLVPGLIPEVVVGTDTIPEVCDGIVVDHHHIVVDQKQVVEAPIAIVAEGGKAGTGVDPVAASGSDVVESMDVVVDGRVVCDANVIRPSIDVVVCESSRGDVSDLSSPNKFETLCSVAVEHDLHVSPRKERFAAAGVADLLNQLKPRGKGVVKSINLKRGKGVKLDTFDAISNEFIQFFTKQLGTVDGHVENFSDDLLKHYK
ncbi:hypothetical protein V6N12_017292 [Hibiscus sabdariffa]|uniref:DUF4283 domain-containing protein n=1 Tax=Hibiscus sabdariffa TaxID=183260 RepID=A0ABR2CF21_9ROSI